MQHHCSSRTPPFLLILTVLLALALTAGCEEPCPWGEDDLPAIDSVTASATTVSAGEDIDLTFELSFFQLTGEENHSHDGDGHDDHGHGGTSACPAGHVHVYLDDLMTNPLGMPTTETATVTIPEDTLAGEHTLIARLHNADHTILTVDDEEVTAELVITVDEIVIGR